MGIEQIIKCINKDQRDLCTDDLRILAKNIAGNVSEDCEEYHQECMDIALGEEIIGETNDYEIQQEESSLKFRQQQGQPTSSIPEEKVEEKPPTLALTTSNSKRHNSDTCEGTGCGRPFSTKFLSRSGRHHCRACAKSICGECRKYAMVGPDPTTKKG